MSNSKQDSHNSPGNPDKRNEEDDEDEKDKQEINDSSSDSDSDLEDIQKHNKESKPFRDNLATQADSQSTAPQQPQGTLVTRRKGYTDADIRDKVKKTMSKTRKDNQRRRVKKGEAGMATKLTKENRLIINDSW